jgi:hypothetical protein
LARELLSAARMRTCALILLASTTAAAAAAAAEKPICVSVTVKSADGKTTDVARDQANLPVGQDPVSYLKRLLEYFVTHEKGFVAVEKDCTEHIDVELYPLRQGWTVFARYSGTGREERVDYLFSDELSQFAERAVLALLYDKPIATTILRDTVLRADSKRAVQRIRGTSHFLLGLGTQIRGGQLPTSQSDGSAQEKIRVFFPITLTLGYRGKFESWGLEALFGLSIGTSESGLQQNIDGGHVDDGGAVNLALHFLRYLNPRGLTSWYLGAGGSFEVLWMYQINSLSARNNGSDNRRTFASGGFDVDLLAGIEFMRASRVQFYLQGALLIPAYVVDNGDGPAAIKTWFPGAALTLGMLF